MNLLFFILFIFSLILSRDATATSEAAASHDRSRTPPPGAAAKRAFNTPDRTIMKTAILPSPPRPGKKPAAEAVIITAANIEGDLAGAPKELILQLLHGQQRPFVIICPFSRGRILRPPSISAAGAAAGAGASPVVEDVHNEITHVILAPTHPSDYEALVKINTDYQASIAELGRGAESFLNRNYGTFTAFRAKLDHLYKMYRAFDNDPLQPLFYQEPAEPPEDDPDFMSSIPFSILGIVNKPGNEKDIEVLGDIWLANFEELDIVCIGGTSERSTMVGLRHQSTGIGQTAVGAFNKYLVQNWLGKKAHLISPEVKVPEISKLSFDGIIAYVEPSNFKSIGNNFRSSNFLIGAINHGKPMLMFRAPSRICTPEHLAVDALTQQETASQSGSPRRPSSADSLPGHEHLAVDALTQQQTASQLGSPRRPSSADSLLPGSDSDDGAESTSSNSHAKNNLFELWPLVKSLYPSRKAVEQGDWVPVDTFLSNYIHSPGYLEKLSRVNEIISAFDGFLPQFSEREVAGSPHFKRLDRRVLLLESEGKLESGSDPAAAKYALGTKLTFDD